MAVTTELFNQIVATYGRDEIQRIVNEERLRGLGPGSTVLNVKQRLKNELGMRGAEDWVAHWVNQGAFNGQDDQG